MSKNGFTKNISKKEDFESSLKETKESDLKYSKIKIIKRLNSQNQIQNDNINSNKNSKLAINIKLKEGNEGKKEEEKRVNNKNMNNLLKELKEKNEKFKLKIDELEEKIMKMSYEYSNNIQNLKKEKEQHENQIKNLLNTNKNLNLSLEALTQRLDKVLINSSQKKIKFKDKPAESLDLQYQLKIKEKELKNQHQLINILLKDNKNVRTVLNNFHVNDNGLNLANKVQSQYKEIITLKKDLNEYQKLAHSSSQENLKANKLKLSSEINTKKKSIRLYLNSLSINKNLNLISQNKFQNLTGKKKYEYKGLTSYIQNEKDAFENIFDFEERDAIKNILGEGPKFQKFLEKINILHKAAITKENEMNMKLKLIENNLKQKEKEITLSKLEIKEKDKIIIELNIRNKELEKNSDELINKIKSLLQILTELEQRNQNIIKENEHIKNSIFNIDGIIEAKSKDGKVIPLLKENNSDNYNEMMKNENYSPKYEGLNEEKTKSFSIKNNNNNEQNFDV